MESLSFSFALVDEKGKKNRNLFIYVCMQIHKFTLKIFHKNNINVSQKVISNPMSPHVYLK